MTFLRWPIDDISDVPRFFRKKDEPLFFLTVISGGNMFPTVVTSRNLFPTVITSRNVFSTVITSGNVFCSTISGVPYSKQPAGLPKGKKQKFNQP